MKLAKILSISLFLSFCTLVHAQDNQRLIHDILQGINAYRMQHGLTKLTLIPSISKVAEQHSLDMAKHRIPFGHDYFQNRVKKLYSIFDPACGSAENIAYNYKTAESVTQGWIHSYGHRQNILRDYNLTGIGLAKDEHGKLYYTQIFVCTPH